MTARRNWIKVYVDQCLRGSMMDELEDPGKRFLWFGFLLLAGDCPFEGYIKLTENIGYTDEQLAALLKVEASLITETKPIMERFDKIKILDNNIIKIVNWKKYQSEYQRQKSYRGKLQPKVITKSNKQIRLDKDKIRKENKTKKEMTEKTDDLFKMLWKQWPPDGRFKKDYCLKKFRALVKQGKLDDFQKTTQGYGEFLKHKQEIDGFVQQVMHLSTWMNNWEGEKEQYMGKEYKPKL